MVSQEDKDFVTKWEGEKLTAYQDGGGVWTIGVGHTSDSHLTVKKGLKITKALSQELLGFDLQEADDAIKKYVKVPINANQHRVLLSFIFNLGVSAFAGSTLLKKLNAGEYSAVPGELQKWCHDNGKVVKGLQNRRADEAALWDTPSAGLTTPKDSANESIPETPRAENPEVPSSTSGGFLAALLQLLSNLFTRS